MLVALALWGVARIVNWRIRDARPSALNIGLAGSIAAFAFVFAAVDRVGSALVAPLLGLALTMILLVVVVVCPARKEISRSGWSWIWRGPQPSDHE